MDFALIGRGLLTLGGFAKAVGASGLGKTAGGLKRGHLAQLGLLSNILEKDGSVMTIWFSSDHHFHHASIIEWQNRPFKTVAEMNDCLVEMHNLVVKPEDHAYFLGDVTMLRDNKGYGLGILKRLNGHKRLIMGNHDHYKVQHYLAYFEKVMAMNVIDRIRFTHIPVHPASMGNVLANVHGHIHANSSEPYVPVKLIGKDGQVRLAPYINVSVEATNYRPVSLEEVKELIRQAISSAQ